VDRCCEPTDAAAVMSADGGQAVAVCPDVGDNPALQAIERSKP
jgi:hypothetical protein